MKTSCAESGLFVRNRLIVQSEMNITANIPRPDLSRTSRARLIVAALVILTTAAAATITFLFIDDMLRYEAPVNILNSAASDIADDLKTDGGRLLFTHKIRTPKDDILHAALNPYAPEMLLAIRRDAEPGRQPTGLPRTLKGRVEGAALRIQETSPEGDSPYTLIILSMTNADTDRIRRNHRHRPSNWFPIIALTAALLTAGGMSPLSILRL